MTTNEPKPVKKTLRHNEYYDIQTVFDNLYEMGTDPKHHFYGLMETILDERNILLAYRSIKRNKGSKTKGTNDTTISQIAEMDRQKYVEMVRKRILNYRPDSVRRVEIPKPNGKTRPLGIATMEDRVVQQCFKQVLEPILEAKFYKHSYGFRPNRSPHNAIARFNHLAFRGYQHVVDIDIKGFFDNVNHGKLLKQLWTIGIRDKQALKVISLMLKAEIEGIGIPTKGTPQGGLLSPLLSNVVLNELDWWIASQCENMPTRHEYSRQSDKVNALRKTKLKDIRIVRYADDFKIMCKDHKTAQKIFIATKKWLKERLDLDISPEKSKITNLRKNYSEFLGFKLKVKKGKKKKYTTRSHMLDKAKERAIEKLKDKIKDICKSPAQETVNKYNAMVMGLHNYYSAATMVNKDFTEIAYKVNKSLKCRTRGIRADTGHASRTYQKYYGEYNYKKTFIANNILFPIAGIKMRIPKNFSPDICNYTITGREKIHSNIKLRMDIIRNLMKNPVEGMSTEYNDNRISLYTGQMGMCYVSEESLEAGRMEVHHKKSIKQGGTDEYKNLAYVTTDIHKLIHATQPKTINEYLQQVKIDENGLIKLNRLRKLVGNDVIQQVVNH